MSAARAGRPRRVEAPADRTAPPGVRPSAAPPPPVPLQEGEGTVRGWFLETLLSGGEKRHIPIHPLPFRIGRGQGMHLRLQWPSVSNAHAEIYAADGGLRLRDMGSTNGCFVDHERIQDVALRQGHIVHFSDSEWRLGFDHPEQQFEKRPETLPLGRFALTENFAKGTEKLKELLSGRRLEMGFQPIVTLPGGAVIGYESLARGRHPELPESPDQLFRIAEAIGAEVELSRLCRRVAVEHLAGARGSQQLFLNTHPHEFREPGLVESLGELREIAPRLGIVLEIHEGLADSAGMSELRTELNRLGIGLAYNDFGAGQARLFELAEVPPDYFKFDMRFIRGIDSAPRSRRRLLSSLIDAGRDLRAVCIAEGIETVEESKACAVLGFTHAQGYYFGRPAFLPAP